jgi:hypothetical protein
MSIVFEARVKGEERDIGEACGGKEATYHARDASSANEFVSVLSFPLPIVSAFMNDSFLWASNFRELFERCVGLYRQHNRDFESWFNKADLEFLASIGYKKREFFDFVEDHVNEGGSEPSMETSLLIAAVRRDYLLVEQNGQTSIKEVPMSELPPKSAALDGFVWLPRIIAKAEAKLRGELDSNTMYLCGGDRSFLSRHNIHPADFLRVVWAAKGDKEKIVRFVKSKQWR